MLIISLFMSGILGLLQEKTYTKYGPHWKEGVFYTVRIHVPPLIIFSFPFTPILPFFSFYEYIDNRKADNYSLATITYDVVILRLQHFLSLPVFFFLGPHVKYGFRSLHAATTKQQSLTTSTGLLGYTSTYFPYISLAANLITQLICVTGVNQLTSVSPISIFSTFHHSHCQLTTSLVWWNR